jgi:hypothetical protein
LGVELEMDAADGGGNGLPETLPGIGLARLWLLKAF